MSNLLNDIPVLDVRGLSEKEEDLQQLAAQLKDAFTNIGFVAITNHNVSKDVVNSAWESVKKFHELPVEVKTKYSEDTKKKKFGWSPLGAQVLYNPGAEIPSSADWREALAIVPAKFDWPSEVPQLKETAMAFVQQIAALGQYVLKLMAIALDLQDREYFTRSHNMCSDKSPSSICFAQYPPIPKGGLVKGQMRCGEHTDWGSITLLIQDEEGGLEVQRCDGSWIETHPPYGTVMVNIGDMMQRWTSDKFISTNHRVREPEEERLKQRMRRSLIYFMDADDDTVVSSLDGSNKYPPILASDYLWQRAQMHLD